MEQSTVKEGRSQPKKFEESKVNFPEKKIVDRIFQKSEKFPKKIFQTSKKIGLEKKINGAMCVVLVAHEINPPEQYTVLGLT